MYPCVWSRCLDSSVTGGIQTGKWYKRTLQAEKIRAGSGHVRLLVLCLFTDGTNLDRLSRNSATPIVVALLNWATHVLKGGAGKKLAGFFPDIKLTSAHRKNDKIKAWVRRVNSAVTGSFLTDVQKLYDEGGLEWSDYKGEVWHFVPVVAFVATDVKEAWTVKGLVQASKCNVPCTLCTLPWKDFDKVLDSRHLQLRSASQTVALVERCQEKIR